MKRADYGRHTLELGCLYLDPYEFYSPDGKRVVCRYEITDFFPYNCSCYTNTFDEEKFIDIDFELDSRGAEGKLGSAIIKLWRNRLIRDYPKVNRMVVEDNKTAIKIHDNKVNLDLYMGWYDGRLTITLHAPMWVGREVSSINLQQYKR